MITCKGKRFLVGRFICAETGFSLDRKSSETIAALYGKRERQSFSALLAGNNHGYFFVQPSWSVKRPVRISRDSPDTTPDWGGCKGGARLLLRTEDLNDQRQMLPLLAV